MRNRPGCGQRPPTTPETPPTTLLRTEGSSGVGEELGAGCELWGGGFVDCDGGGDEGEVAGCEPVFLGAVDGGATAPVPELDVTGVGVVVRGAAVAEDRLDGLDTGGAAAGCVGAGVLAASNCAEVGGGRTMPGELVPGSCATGGATWPRPAGAAP
jgi:hypothetical protein